MSRYPDDDKAIQQLMKSTGVGYQKARRLLQKDYSKKERNRKHGTTGND